MNVQEKQKFPQLGDEYWYITDGGDVDSFGWEFVEFDLSAQAMGNVYKTEQQAQFAAEKLKVEAELRKYSRPFKEDENNFFIQTNSSHNNIVIDADDYSQIQGVIYFESQEKAQQAIQSVGEERVKKYIFGVED